MPTDPITIPTHDGGLLTVYVTAGGALTFSVTDAAGNAVAALTEAQSDHLWDGVAERRAAVR